MAFVNLKKNTEYIFLGILADTADATTAKTSANIATGDFQVSTDGGAFGNLDTIPAVTPAAGAAIKITLSADEMNGDYIIVRAKDVAGAEWNENHWVLTTTTNDIDDVKADTAAILVDTTAIEIDTTSIETKVDTAQTDITELLGLGMKNIFIDTTTFSNNKLTSARYRVYNSKANAETHGAGGLLATYTTTVTYTGNDMDDYLNVLEP